MKSNLIDLSIIIPIYNRAYLIQSLISNIQNNKTKVNYEIIIINDGSSDKPINEIKKINNKNIKFINKLKNDGPGISRNLGIGGARGKWIYFLDSDDQIKKSFFDKFTTIKNTKNEIVIFKSNIFESKYDHNNVFTENNKTKTLKLYLENKLDQSVIFSFFKKEFLLKNKLEFREGFHEDVDFMFCSLYKANFISYIDEKLINKNQKNDSITKSFSKKHINGYFNALDTIYKKINKKDKNELLGSFILGLINLTSSRLKYIFNQDLKKSENECENDLIECLLDAHSQLINKNLLHSKVENFVYSDIFQTQYIQIYKLVLESLKRNDSKYDFIKNLMNKITKKWSCYDLENSVFLAPDQIRTCCKRFYYKNKIKGDVKLIEKQKIIKLEDIVKTKKLLIDKINTGVDSECTGCPHLEFKDWGSKDPLENGIKYLSIENHSICNMRCTYCDETFYGGIENNYNFSGLIKDFVQNDKLKNSDYIVWGGGEPLLKKNFIHNVKEIAKFNNKSPQRIITNCSVYSKILHEMLIQNKAYIVTSIDAGSEETFQEIRKSNLFNKVLSNIKKYSLGNHNNLIIKYIIDDINSSIKELDKFSELIIKNNLTTNIFQISCNFKIKSINKLLFKKIIYLNAKLLNSKCKYVFLDDLIWQRINKIDFEQYNEIKIFLKKYNLDHFLNEQKNNNLYVWGNGKQYNLLKNKSYFFKKNKFISFIDTRKNEIHSNKQIKTIRPNKEIISNGLILIAAVQTSSFIINEISKFNKNLDCVYKKIII